MEENVNQTEKEMAENEKQNQTGKEVAENEKQNQTGKEDRNDPGTDRTAGGGAERKGTLEQKSRVCDEDDERDRKIKRIYIF